MPDSEIHTAIEQAAQAIAAADALLVTAGAGMGVDSGLPDFRGNEGFWRAYPPFAERGLSFVDLAQPGWFQEDPELAWGFYGHRLSLYRRTTTHAGFTTLLHWAQQKPDGYFVFTSNVDGQFQKAGFDGQRIVEYHGSIHHLQCSLPCCQEIWSADDVDMVVDETTFHAEPPLPQCPHCGAFTRPNILMFNDGQWLWTRTQEQERRFHHWMSGLAGKELIIVECGAGTAVPSVRRLDDQLLREHGARLIRINPRESHGPPGTVSLPLGALEALATIQRAL
ncbi:MAG: NAD-dependent deacetylase [Armatimonadota bacterium]|nr:NAD-dependent deacetylase [Armatimonadota bacterium]